jgi:hypothetical protein
MSVRAALLVGLVALVGSAVAGCGEAIVRPVRVASVSVAPSSRTFVSLFPACGCSNHVTLDAFSAMTGRRLGSLATISSAPDENVATPAADRDGKLWLTFTQGARCALRGTFSQCPKIARNSCVNQVRSLIPGQHHLKPAFSEPGAVQIGPVVPDRAGTLAVFSQTPCTQSHRPAGLYVRDLATGRQHALVTRANRCDQFISPAFNATATQLVFVYDQAIGRAPSGGGEAAVSCPQTINRLAVLNLHDHGTRPSMRIIRPDRGCVFSAAAFDREGLLATEGCKRGSRPAIVAPVDGDAYLLQTTADGHRTNKIALKRGLEKSVISPGPDGDSVLITQDQPANNDEPENDWVWTYNGTHLKPIAHYHANDAAQVLAVAW